jgi:hypothetical protein
MRLYNMTTWFCAMIIVLMLLFIAIAFQQPTQPSRSANFPGKDFEGRISDGLKSSPGLKTKEYK